MPVVRVSRDKRGYEHVYLIHVGGDRARLLYWFRTPPGVKVGREPLDAATRQAIEAGNPDVAFDWRSLTVSPPAAEQPNWRERRLAARAAKKVRAENDGDAVAPPDSAREGGASRGRRRRRSPATGTPPEAS